VATKTSSKALTTRARKFAQEAKFKALLDKAQAAGLEAGEKARPTPMIVGTAIGLSDEIDTSKRTYYVPDGVCGFAWVKFPGTTAFARWARDNGHARKDSYAGGYLIWIREHGQSYVRKGAHAQAMAEVLREGGVKGAFADGRMD
jgi:hypothetical protein